MLDAIIERLEGSTQRQAALRHVMQDSGACELVKDVLEDVYRCEHCESTFTLTDDA